MKLELHLLQNFAPSNLNRDDTGAPKDCELGGYRRARISSQCQKRAVRETFRLDKLVDPDTLGARTKRLAIRVADELVAQHGHDRDSALALTMGAIEGVGLGKNKKGAGDDLWKTEYLLFVPRRLVRELTALLHENRDALAALAADKAPADDAASETDVPAADAAPAEGAKKGKKPAAPKKDPKKQKTDAKNAYPKEVREAVEGLLERARRTVDVALFGRMLADKPEWNVDASCQVAQAISTNRVQMDFDFFTAVDDFKPKDSAGSDMMGTVTFNSSCFYRYAVLDVDALRANLDGGDELLGTSLNAFVRAFVSAIPTGKQNSMAAHNFPSYALAVVRREGQSISLTNAFLKPARPRGEDVDLVDDSIKKLEDYAARLRDAIGDGQMLSWADRDLASGGVNPTRAKGLNEFFADVTRHATGAAS
jgi:CRISPR system Cascade subunit CasC